MIPDARRRGRRLHLTAADIEGVSAHTGRAQQGGQPENQNGQTVVLISQGFSAQGGGEDGRDPRHAHQQEEYRQL